MGSSRPLQHEVEKWLLSKLPDICRVPLLGLCGAQGIGKTTALRGLEARSDLNIALLSLDDFYLTRSE